MDRTDRLYAFVEKLRASTPVTASSPARPLDTSVRTIEHDLTALQQAGVPLYAAPGHWGGWGADASRPLPPITLTAREATAIAVALARTASTPFASAGRAALQKVLATMTDEDAAAARRLSERVRRYHSAADDPGTSSPVPPAAVDEAIAARVVVRLDYEDRAGVASTRAVEPLAAVEADSHWYLWAWCRLRDGARMFRMDRIRRLVLTEEPAPERGLDVQLFDLPALIGRAALD